MFTESQVRRVLAAVGVDIEAEVGEDFIVFCPYHNNWRSPAGEVSMTNGFFYCFSCNATASLDRFVMKVSGRTYFEALRLIKSKEEQSDIIGDVIKTLERKPEFVPFDQSVVTMLHNNLLDYPEGTNYFRSRKINAHSEDYFDLGYSAKNQMVTVPVHSPDGMLLGFVARSIDGKVFKNSQNLPKSKTLFNLHRVKSEPFVFVVESSFDVIRLSQAGIPAVATLGAGVSTRQAKLLDQYFNTVISVPDQDAAGIEMDDKLRKALGNKLSSILLPSGAKDVGDLTDEQIKKLKYHVADPLLGVL